MAQANIFIAHESPFVPIGDKAGGAALVAFEQTKSFQAVDSGNHYRIVSPFLPDAQGAKSRLDNVFFEKPSLTGPALAKALTRPKYLDLFYEIFKDAKFNYGHYFVAGKVLINLKDRLNSPVIYMAHTWEKIVCHYDKTRTPNLKRIEIESEILEKSDLIIIATQAEKRDLIKLYANSKISQSKILAKTLVVSLGINK